MGKQVWWLGVLVGLMGGAPCWAGSLETFRTEPDRRLSVRQSLGARAAWASGEQQVVLVLGMSVTEAAKNPNAYRIISEEDSAYAYPAFVRPLRADVRDEVEAPGVSGGAFPQFARRVVTLDLPFPLKPGATYHVLAQGVDRDMVTAARTAATFVYGPVDARAERDPRLDLAVIGLRAIEPVGHDMIMVEFGPGLAPGAARVADAWSITVNRRPVAIQGMGRITRVDTYLPTGWPFTAIPQHELFVQLEQPLADGDVVEVTVDETVTAGWREARMIFREHATYSSSIKVNQVGYLTDSPVKRAYLGRWLGSYPEAIAGRQTVAEGDVMDRFRAAVLLPEDQVAAAVTETAGGAALWFDAPPSFALRNAETDEVVFQGEAELVHRSGDMREGYFEVDHSGENVYVLDFAAFTGEGTFYLSVPTVGRSVDFRIGADVYEEAFRVASYGIFAQRCGIELAPPHSPWRRVACHRDGIIPTTLERRAGERVAHERMAECVDYGLLEHAPQPEALQRLNRDPALLAYWPLDGNLQDASGRARHLTALLEQPGYVAAPALKPAGNRAMGPTRNLQTNGAVLNDLSLDVANGFSMTAWIRFPGGTKFGGVLLGQPGHNVHEERIQITAGWGVIRAVVGKGGSVLDVGRLSDGDWHHLAVVVDPQAAPETPAQMRFYVDGDLRATGHAGTVTPDLPKPFMVANLEGEDAPGKYIDEVRIFQRALAREEVVAASRQWGRQALALQAYGGHHDAGDYNPRSHISVAQYLMNAYEMAPQKFFDGQLNIPESGNGVPDVLDEAMWSLRLWVGLQDEDGGVWGGTESDGDPNFIQSVDLDRLGDFAFAKEPGASYEYAGVMAQAARIWRALGHDGRASMFLDRALRAFVWASNNPIEDPASPGEWADFYLSSKAYAAAQLLHTTGDQVYAEVFANAAVWSINPDAELSRHRLYNQRLAAWAYATCDVAAVDPALQSVIRKAIIAEADYFIENASTMAYRFIRHPKAPITWGTGAYQNFLDSTIWAWHLTGDERYRTWMVHTFDNTLGANPLGRSYITGLGTRTVRAPLHNSRYNPTGEVVPGMQVQGPDQNGPGYRVQETAYPKLRNDFAILYTFVDTHFAIAMNEGTVVPQVRTMAAFSMLLPDR